MKKREMFAALVVLSTTASALVVAQTDGPYEDPKAPDEEHVLFNGGISLEERDAAPDAGTKLEFFEGGGAYLAEVHVVVADQSGAELVNTVTAGPWLILDLPEGTYNVQASLGGNEVQSGMIEVDGSVREYGYMFPTH